MCLGPPKGVANINNESSAAYTTALNQAKTEFGDSSTAFNDLMSSMSPIAKAGPGQTGWTAQEASAINAQTVDQTAAAYKNAASAVRSGEAAVGGGNIALPSGANLATEEAIANEGAVTEASGLRQNLIQNYEQGNKNWQFAEGGIQKAPSVFSDANAATGEATTSGKEAMSNAQTVAKYPTWANLAIGVLGDVGGNAIGDPMLGNQINSTIQQSTGQQG